MGRCRKQLRLEIPVKKHMGQRPAAACRWKRQQSGLDRICKVGVGNFHLQDGLSFFCELAPDPQPIEHPPRAFRKSGCPGTGPKRGVGLVDQNDFQRPTGKEAKKQGQRQPGGATARNRNIPNLRQSFSPRLYPTC
jgi:hypothetical protein